MKYFINTLFITLSIFFLYGCNSNHSKSNPSVAQTNTETGLFIDSKVDGLFYKTPSHSGFTSDGGSFDYTKGEKITFYIGKDEHGLKLGSSIAKDIITPRELTSDDTTGAKGIKIVQLLLSIATLSDDNKTMTISPQTQTKFQNSTFKEQSYLDIIQNTGFYYDANSTYSTPLCNFLINSKIAKKIYNESEATQHFSNTLASLTPKIGILLNFQNHTFKDLHGILSLPLIEKSIKSYLKNEHSIFEDIQFVPMDTKNDKNIALAELKQLKDMGIKIVIGPVSSSMAQALLDYANKNNIILLSPSSTSSALSIENDNLYRTAPSDKQQATALAKLIENNKKIKYILPIYRDDIYGQGYYKTIKSELEKSNITLLEPILSNDSNLISSATEALKGYDKEQTAVVLIEFQDQAKAILQNIGTSALLSSIQWYSNNSLINTNLTPALKSIAEKTKLSGVTYTTDDEEIFVYYRTVVSQLKENNISYVDPFLINIWDAVWLSTEVYTQNAYMFLQEENNSSSVTEQIKALLPSIAAKTYGVTGFMTLNKYGDREGCNFSYYTFFHDKWNHIGMYKEKPYEANIFNVTSINTRVVDKNVTIGAIINNASWNTYSKELIELAKTRLNQFYKDKHIKFHVDTKIIENNSSDVDKFTNLDELEDLYKQGIKSVITIVPSRSLALMQDFANEKGVYLIDCASTAPSLAKPDTTYRLTPNDNGEVKALVYKLNRDNIQNVVVIHVDDNYGNDYFKAFKEQFGGTILKEIPFQSDTMVENDDITEALQDMNNTSYAIIYVALSNEGIDFNNLTPTLREHKWYGSGSSSFDTRIAKSNLDFTFITYSPKGMGIIMPQSYILNLDLNSTNVDMTNINAYDAMYLSTISNFDAADLNITLGESLNRRIYNMYGIASYLGVDVNGDKATLSYAFYKLIDNKWMLSDIYNNSAYGIVNDN